MNYPHTVKHQGYELRLKGQPVLSTCGTYYSAIATCGDEPPNMIVWENGSGEDSPVNWNTFEVI